MKSKTKYFLSECVFFLTFVFFLSLVYTAFNNKKLYNGVYIAIDDDFGVTFNNGTNIISIVNAFPETEEEARNDPNNQLSFTITGENKSDENIVYDIKLKHAQDELNKVRIKDKDLRFDLIEIIDNNENVIVENQEYDSLDDIVIHTNNILGKENDINRTYKLRMWINEDIIISDSLEYADYKLLDYKNSYANIKVIVQKNNRD